MYIYNLTEVLTNLILINIIFINFIIVISLNNLHIYF